MQADLTSFTEAQIRLVFFLGILLIIATWEVFWPRRKQLYSRAARWPSNIGIVVLNTLILRIMFPTAAVGVAEYASANQLGVLNQFNFGITSEIIIAVLVLDAAIYFQHVMFHAVPLFWRLHRMHHADPDFDVTTGARFHPVEIILSMLIKFAVIIFLGPAAIAVIIFEILLNATAMFNHGNISIPLNIDKYLRLFVVTPDMHRVHHSVDPAETNSNFGFNLPWWDRLFGTYKAQPLVGHESMTIGLVTFTGKEQITKLPGMLLIPFAREEHIYPLNRGSLQPGKRSAVNDD
jgi:sterol desaturase/sphingolipid hydroxylase (fatty acid hydroxylase superfamily)